MVVHRAGYRRACRLSLEMSEHDGLYSRDELLGAFEILHHEAAEVFAAVDPDAFFRRPEEGVWSPGENVVHLIKSVKAVADAMRLPKLLLRLLFGAAGASRTYAEVREAYRAQLAKGAVAAGRFVPQPPPADDPEAAERSRRRALGGWRRTGDGLVRALAKWSEPALDTYRLPHPLLGKLTVREMLFFTHYHDLHHLAAVRRLTGTSDAG